MPESKDNLCRVCKVEWQPGKCSACNQCRVCPKCGKCFYGGPYKVVKADA